MSGWAYKRNKSNVSEQRDITYLRNKLKLTYHYILSYIYSTFIVRHNKRIIYFKNIYKTDLCNCLKRNAKGTHLYRLINGGLISGWAYIRNNTFVANGWAYIGGGGGGLISGEGFKVGFYGITTKSNSKCCQNFNKS